MNQDTLALEVLSKQLEFFLITGEEKQILKTVFPIVLRKYKYCIKYVKNKYYKKDEDGEPIVNPYHTGQWSIFLYWAARVSFIEIGLRNDLSDKIYFLNKMMNSVDIFYEVEMPSQFYLDHPVGSIIGRAQIGEKFSFRQNCNIGNNKGVFPKIGHSVKMLASSRILGDCLIGNNVLIASGTIIKDQSVPDNKIVFGTSPDLSLKENTIHENYH